MLVYRCLVTTRLHGKLKICPNHGSHKDSFWDAGIYTKPNDSSRYSYMSHMYALPGHTYALKILLYDHSY